MGSTVGSNAPLTRIRGGSILVLTLIKTIGYEVLVQAVGYIRGVGSSRNFSQIKAHNLVRTSSKRSLQYEFIQYLRPIPKKNCTVRLEGGPFAHP